MFERTKVKTFADWFEYYKSTTISMYLLPMLEATEKIKAYYFAKGIDIFKDACTLPGVSLQYLLRGSKLKQGNEDQLYAPKRRRINC